MTGINYKMREKQKIHSFSFKYLASMFNISPSQVANIIH